MIRPVGYVRWLILTMTILLASSSVHGGRPCIDIHFALSFNNCPSSPSSSPTIIHSQPILPSSSSTSQEYKQPIPPITRPTPPGPDPTPDDDNVVEFWPHFFALFISSCYLALCLMSMIQLCRTIVHRHKIQSFRFGFLGVCFLWTLLRVIFWFMVDMHSWPTWLADLIYFLPNACQIATFSLLILFYAKLVHRHRWRMLRLRFLGFCILSNVAMVFLTLTFSILMDRVQSTEHDDPTSSDAQSVKEFVYKMYFISSAVFFGALVSLAGFYIHKLRTIRGSTAGTSKQEVLMTSMIFLIFLSRTVWDLLAAFYSDSTLFRHQIWETTTTHTKLMNLATFLLLYVWEIIPTLVVIIYFRNIPNTSDSYCVGRWSCFQHSCARTYLTKLCAFPDDYFIPIETSPATRPPSQLEEHPTDATGATGGAGPEYSQMTDDEPPAVSSALPSTSFVRSSSVTHSQIGRSYTNMAGLQINAANGAKGNATYGHTDLYGSPTWLNPTHPALNHLSASLSQNHAVPNTTQYQPQYPLSSHALIHPSSSHSSSGHSQYSYSHRHYEEEEDGLGDEFRNSVHPYTQAARAASTSRKEEV